MKKFTIYQVDAFAKEVFAGNPAAVIPLEEWPDDLLMQKIAMENNLAETAFFIPSSSENNEYDIRWFTPESELIYVDMPHWPLLLYFIITWILKNPRLPFIPGWQERFLT